MVTRNSIQEFAIDFGANGLRKRIVEELFIVIASDNIHIESIQVFRRDIVKLYGKGMTGLRRFMCGVRDQCNSITHR
jgi:hypothetical protein